MATAKAQGQFTIVDYNDAITLSGYLSCDSSKNQRYSTDSNSYNPNWKQSPVTIVPNLYKAGSTDELFGNTTTRKQIKSVKWYADNSEIKATTGVYSFTSLSGGFAGSLNYKLVIEDNIIDKNSAGIDIRCDIVYQDPASKLDMLYSCPISFSLVRDGGGLVAIEVTTPDGEVFKNDDVKELRVISRLWRGSEVDESSVNYKFAYNDDDVISSESSGYDGTFGTGWHKISSGTNYTVNGNTLTVKPSAVDGMVTIRCAIIDTDFAQEKDYVSYIDAVTIVDRSDRLEVVITSTNGNIFKNEQGTIVLTANAYRGEAEPLNKNDSGTSSSNICGYSWSQYDENGTLTNKYINETAGNQYGKTLTVTPAMVSSKSTFWCEVTYPKATQGNS